MMPMKPHDYGERYYRMINTLSGKAQDQIVEFLNWIFTDNYNKMIYKMILGCDDPSPVLDQLWYCYIWGIEPSKSLVFKEFVIKYIPLSVALNFQDKDSDLSRQALLVGNIGKEKRPIEELE